MAENNSAATFAGFLKTNYVQNVVNTIPQDFVGQRDFEYAEDLAIGKGLSQAVITAMEQGVTYQRAAQGSFTLNEAVAGSIEEATVDGYNCVLLSGMSYEALAKAVQSGKLAYGSSGDQLMKNMAQSARKRMEIDIWNGQSLNGLGVVSSEDNTTITFTAASWCPGNWIGMENAVCHMFDATGATLRVGTNTTFTVSSMSIPDKQVTFSTLPTDAAANDFVCFEGQVVATPTHNSMLGLVTMAGLTTGNLFGLAVTKSAWGPNRYNVNGQISFAKLQAAIETSAYKGLTGGATAYIPVSSWNNLLTEQAALRRYGGEFDGRVELVNGANAIKFQTMVGPLTIKPVIYLQDGFGVIAPEQLVKRGGATDVTFKVPNMNEPLLTVGGSVAGVQLQCYWNQFLFTPEPSKLTQLYGITV